MNSESVSQQFTLSEVRASELKLVLLSFVTAELSLLDTLDRLLDNHIALMSDVKWGKMGDVRELSMQRGTLYHLQRELAQAQKDLQSIRRTLRVMTVPSSSSTQAFEELSTTLHTEIPGE